MPLLNTMDHCSLNKLVGLGGSMGYLIAFLGGLFLGIVLTIAVVLLKVSTKPSSG